MLRWRVTWAASRFRVYTLVVDGKALGTVHHHTPGWSAFVVEGYAADITYLGSYKTAQEARRAVWKEAREWQTRFTRWQLGEAAWLAFPPFGRPP